MLTAIPKDSNETYSYTSSVIHDVWKPKTGKGAFYRWYFDALSEDGRDAVVILFHDNFIFSPRYNSSNNDERNGSTAERIPAVAFFYYRDGKPVHRTVNEFSEEDFFADKTNPGCTIGDNSFSFRSAPYGSGYFISVNSKLSRGRRLEAHFEWLSIESDFSPQKETIRETGHLWNMVVSRSDVTGRITVSGEDGVNLDVIHFRGTGYHDHNSDDRWISDSICDWQWGRAHFSDSTAVYNRVRENKDRASFLKFVTIREGVLREHQSEYNETGFKRSKFGLKFPTRQTFLSDDGVRLRVKNQNIIDSNFFYLRFLSEMTLTLRDGKPRKTVGITEYLAPKAMKYRWLDWLVNLQIGRNGKAAFFS